MKNRPTILIVDDDADDRALFIKAVEETGQDIECITARDGRHALEFLQNPQTVLPDLIFLDLRMPRFSGKKCLSELKKDERLKHIPVVIYTTSRELDESQELKDMGAVHFVSKPNNPEEIYFLVSLVLEENLNNL